MTPRPAPLPHAGFTLVELLVALAILGVILAMLVRVAGQVAENTWALNGRMEVTSEAARLRRLLHRDCTSALQDSLRLTNGGFSLTTSHNLLSGQPLPVEAEWDFSAGAVRRIERIPSQRYSKEILLTADLADWKAEVFTLDARRWTDLRTLMTALGLGQVSGLRLTLDLPGGRVEMIEPLPRSN